MKNQVILLLTAAALLSSCAAHRARICNTCPEKIVRHDSIVEKIVEVPVTLPPVPGPTLYIKSPCDSAGKLKTFTIEKKQNGIKTTVKATPEGLEITSNLEDSTKTKVPVKQKEIYSKTESIIAQKEPCINERTAWDGFYKIGFWIYSCVLALVVGGWYIKKRFWP
jgi:hypothetical protein